RFSTDSVDLRLISQSWRNTTLVASSEKVSGLRSCRLEKSLASADCGSQIRAAFGWKLSIARDRRSTGRQLKFLDWTLRPENCREARLRTSIVYSMGGGCARSTC